MSDRMCVYEDVRSVEFDSAIVVGCAFECVLKLLEHLTLDELHALKPHVAHRITEHTLDQEYTIAGGPDGTDEDGDEVLDPTPLEGIDPTAGVRQAIDEADGD